MKNDRFHGRVGRGDRRCERPGCPEVGEFRAPGPRGSSFDGPGDYRWYCLDHVREFNAGYDWFEGMSAEDIIRAQHPVHGWDRQTRALSPTAGIDAAPRWADFADPLEAISARARARQPAQRHDGRAVTPDERRALDVLGLGIDGRSDLYSLGLIGYEMLSGEPAVDAPTDAAVPAMAAEVDRASAWRQFWSITLPMVLPFVMLAVLFRGIENFKMFDMVNLLTSGGPGSTTELASITLKREAFEKWRTGYASALAIIMFVSIYGLSLEHEAKCLRVARGLGQDQKVDVLTTFLGAGLSTISLAADWSRFRGPNGSGRIAPGTRGAPLPSPRAGRRDPQDRARPLRLSAVA